jgi:hypothetical protein
MRDNLAPMCKKIAAESSAEVGKVVYSNLKRKLGEEEVWEL